MYKYYKGNNDTLIWLLTKKKQTNTLNGKFCHTKDLLVDRKIPTSYYPMYHSILFGDYSCKSNARYCSQEDLIYAVPLKGINSDIEIFI